MATPVDAPAGDPLSGLVLVLGPVALGALASIVAYYLRSRSK